MLKLLIDDLERYCRHESLQLIVTLNVGEILPFTPESRLFPIRIITNDAPKGFASNHNAASVLASNHARYICILNPDIRLSMNPFPALKYVLQDKGVALAAPAVVTPTGELSDSARRVPTPMRLLRRYAKRSAGRPECLAYPSGTDPEWVAGMCMVARLPTFRELRGFDERYRLYVEDVELCLRARHLGYRIALVAEAEVIHPAQRDSHRRTGYMLRHIQSLARFYFSRTYFQYLLRRNGRKRA